MEITNKGEIKEEYFASFLNIFKNQIKNEIKVCFGCVLYVDSKYMAIIIKWIERNNLSYKVPTCHGMILFKSKLC